MRKLRPTTVITHSTVTTLFFRHYLQKKAKDQTLGFSTSLIIENRSTNIFYRVFINDILQKARFDDETISEAYHGLDTSFLFQPNIGDTIRILAYRLGEGQTIFDYLSCFVGECEGVFNERGFVLTRANNIKHEPYQTFSSRRKYELPSQTCQASGEI